MLIDGFYNYEIYIVGVIDVVLFVLIIGGFLGVVNKMGVIDVGIEWVIVKFNGKDEWMIFILMVLFVVGGIIYGMVEELLFFYMLLVLVMMVVCFDLLVVVVIVLFGVGIGMFGLIINFFVMVIVVNVVGIFFI